MKILLIDGYCESHVGNDVLLESSLVILKKTYPNAEYIIHAKKPDSFKNTHNIDCGLKLFGNHPKNKLGKILSVLRNLCFMSIQLINSMTLNITPHKIAFGSRRKSLIDYEEADLCVSISGEMINDTFRWVLPDYLFMFWMATVCKCKVIVFPQSIGPLHLKWTRYLVRKVFSKLDVVTARDAASFKEVKSLGIPEEILLSAPDVGVIQPLSNTDEVNEYLHDLSIDLNDGSLWVGLTVSQFVERGSSAVNYLETLQDVLNDIAQTKDISVLIMPANMPILGNEVIDYETALSVAKALHNSIKVRVLPRNVISARLFKGITQRLDIFISTRMHASILATMALTPTITINTQLKLGGYMKSINQEAYSLYLDDVNRTALKTKILEMLDDRDDIALALDAARLERQDKIEEYSQRLRVFDQA